MRSQKPKAPRPDEIKAARIAAHLTQTQAAEKIGYTERAWQDWEGGRRGMRRALFDLFRQRCLETQKPG
jgi:DNA-binding transcriptional regulator YiaG